jgi:hypothetical protein
VTRSPAQLLSEAIGLAKMDEFLPALTMFIDVYGTDEDSPRLQAPKMITGLSWFGLSLALVRKQIKPGVDLCRRAIDLEFYNGDHYANLARVYVAANNRRKALETLEAGMKVAKDNDYLLSVRKSMGIRSRVALPFLDRTNPINVSLGQARHAKQLAEKTVRKKKT